jgi:hypothetical protein
VRLKGLVASSGKQIGLEKKKKKKKKTELLHKMKGC